MQFTLASAHNASYWNHRLTFAGGFASYSNICGNLFITFVFKRDQSIGLHITHPNSSSITTKSRL